MRYRNELQDGVIITTASRAGGSGVKGFWYEKVCLFSGHSSTDLLCCQFSITS